MTTYANAPAPRGALFDVAPVDVALRVAEFEQQVAEHARTIAKLTAYIRDHSEAEE